jgi:UDP-4-amino-4,6-dideoxy-N-acetyl-beta-L-altrosamine transaminase
MSKYHIPYGRQLITQDDIDEVVTTLQADFLTQGPKIAEFESNFAKYVDAKYAVAVANGTAALHLSLIAMDIKAGDHVITTPITFAATANAALYIGANVHFADINPDTYVLDAESIEQLIKQHPKGFFKAVLPVDFAGYPVNTEAIRQVADQHGLKVLEDACHAPGAFFTDSKGIQQKAGNGIFAHTTAFSFHPVKHIAAGEGGMITTNDEEIYKKLIALRSHGISKENMQYQILDKEKQGAWYYEMHNLGYNFRITDIQAALGNSQLKKADAGMQRRQEIAQKYRKAFAGLPIKMQAEDKHFFNAHHLFVIEIDKRKELYNYLRKNGIFAQIHYIPVHLLDYYSRFGWKKGDFPKAENYYEKTLSLPMFPGLTDDELDYVIKTIKDFYI